MLENLHVKNLALIQEADVDFTDHLNVLTGETGAGKSVLLGSMNLALGGRMSKDMIRAGAKEALVELVFYEDREEILEKLALLDIRPEEQRIMISRRYSLTGRTSTRINGEQATLSTLKEVSSLLLDIHSQHENQSLMDKGKHLEILDRYGGEKEKELRDKLKDAYASYTKICSRLKQMEIPEEERLREKAFLEYEMAEIEQAQLKDGEEERLEEAYRKMHNSGDIAENLSMILRLLGDGMESESRTAEEMFLHSLRAMQKIKDYDNEILELSNELEDLESLLSQFSSDVRSYLEHISYDEQEFQETEERLDRIRSIKARYGSTEEEVKKYYQKISEKKQLYEEYEETKKQLEVQKEACEQELGELCGQLSAMRKAAAEKLTVQIVEALKDLNFLDVRFLIDFRRLPHFTADGYDEAEFLISTNPGQEPKPLAKIASGGELSRIMLAIKSVMADKDQIGTLIFDEIDTGISGRTAQKVSEKLSMIAESHQVLCITHLPQIAAMADSHYKIEKSTDGTITTTTIASMDEKASIDELARMLGGARITQAVIKSAEEMRMLAERQKSHTGH